MLAGFSVYHRCWRRCGLLAAAGVIWLVAWILPPSPHPFGAVSTDTTAAKVTLRQEAGVIHVRVENSELSEVTMTFDFNTENLSSSVAFPHTATFKTGEAEAFTLRPTEPGKPWGYSYTNYYKLGSHESTHDDSAVYRLPYAPGKSYRVTQGYNGRYSHHGPNQYAIDWKMAEGTAVHAARGGLVVKVKQDSDVSGSSMRYDRFNNYVVIRHDDGTLGHYCHLKRNGVKISAGQRVLAGDFIALSGNTGFSSGAHLHFCVFKTRDGRERLSIPVRFATANAQPVGLVEGRSYRAPRTRGTQTASLRPQGSAAVQ